MGPIDARKKLEQLRRKKNKPGTKKSGGGSGGASSSNRSGKNVQDLRQLIAKKKKVKGEDKQSPNKVQSGRITKSRSNNTNGGTPRDLRDSNRKLAARKPHTSGGGGRTDGRQLRRSERAGPSSGRPAQAAVNRNNGNNNQNSRRVASSQVASVSSYKSGKKQVQHQQQQYYVPPHMQHQHPATYIIAPAAAPPQSKLAMDNFPQIQHQSGASVLVSNLMPSITQSEIIELFGDVGVMTAVNMINQTTALVTYQNSSDAVEAVKVYHNRLLDGKPMLVYMMPNSTPTTTSSSSMNVRSRIK